MNSGGDWDAVSNDFLRDYLGSPATGHNVNAGPPLNSGNARTAAPSYGVGPYGTDESVSPTKQWYDAEPSIEGPEQWNGPYYQQAPVTAPPSVSLSGGTICPHGQIDPETARCPTYRTFGENDVRASGHVNPGYLPVQSQHSTNALHEPTSDRACSLIGPTQPQSLRTASSRLSSPAFSVRAKDACECAFRNKGRACGKRFKRTQYNQGKYCNKHMAKVKKEELAQHPPVWTRDEDLGRASTEELSSALFPEIPPMVYEGDGHDDWRAHESHEEAWVERLIQAANTEYTGSYDETAELELDERERQNKARVRANARKQQIDYNHKPFEESSKAWYTNDWVNRRFRLMFRSVLVFHKGGRLIYPVGGSNNGYGENRKLKMSERLSFIERVFQNDKRVVMDMIEGRGVTALVVNPTRFAERKDSNNKCNQNKKRKAQDLEVDGSKSISLKLGGQEEDDGECEYAPAAHPPPPRRRRNVEKRTERQQQSPTSRMIQSAAASVVQSTHQQPSNGSPDVSDQLPPPPQDYQGHNNDNAQDQYGLWQHSISPIECSDPGQQHRGNSHSMPLHPESSAQRPHPWGPQSTIYRVFPTPPLNVLNLSQKRPPMAIDPALLSAPPFSYMPYNIGRKASRDQATSQYSTHNSTTAPAPSPHNEKTAFPGNMPSAYLAGSETAKSQLQHSAGAPIFNLSGSPTEAADEVVGSADEAATSGVCNPSTTEDIRQIDEILGDFGDLYNDQDNEDFFHCGIE